MNIPTKLTVQMYRSAAKVFIIFRSPEPTLIFSSFHHFIFKVIEFGMINKLGTRVLRDILTAVLTKSSQETLLDMFKNVVTSPQHKLFSQGLQIFIHMALTKPQKDVDSNLLNSRINFLDSIWGE